jgi:hypothetical protein
VEIPATVSQGLTNTTNVFARNAYGVATEIELTTHIAAFQEVGGQIVIEAEHFGEQIERSSRAWLTQTVLSDYTGPGYLSALPDTDLRFTTAYTGTSPEVRYTLYITTTGTYTVWLRGYAPNGAGDSAYISLDSGGQPAVTVTGFVPQAWHWTNVNAQGGLATIEVTEAGLYTLHLWQREDGLRVDRILLTTNGGYTPTENGPPESKFE